MEIWSRAAFRALEECRTAMEARKASERLEGSEKIQKEPGAAPERQQAPGSHATTGGGLGGDHTAQRGTRSGLERERGTVSGSFPVSHRTPDAGETDVPKDRANAPSVSGKLRNAAGARLDGVGSSSLRPAVLIASNDNRKGHCRPSQAITLLR